MKILYLLFYSILISFITLHVVAMTEMKVTNGSLDYMVVDIFVCIYLLVQILRKD